MAVERLIERILRLYPADCHPSSAEPWSSPNGFSGAGLWRVTAPRGELCLRQWPARHPTPKRLEFIQAVLWHVVQEGFSLVPLPLETHHHHGYVWHNGHLWELTPWLPGEANYRRQPTRQKLRAAMTALAQFHRAASSFPLAEPGPLRSPGIAERTARLEHLLTGGLDQLHAAVADEDWPEAAGLARRLLPLARQVGPKLLPNLQAAGRLRVALQPCLRDIWHPHVLFEDDAVSGIVDFGAMRSDNVATDVARLLGSLAGDASEDWHFGLTAYQGVRPLSDDEMALVRAFDSSTVLLGGLQWLEWIYLDGHEFPCREAVIGRMEEFAKRLARLAQTVG